MQRITLILIFIFSLNAAFAYVPASTLYIPTDTAKGVDIARAMAAKRTASGATTNKSVKLLPNSIVFTNADSNLSVNPNYKIYQTNTYGFPVPKSYFGVWGNLTGIGLNNCPDCGNPDSLGESAFVYQSINSKAQGSMSMVIGGMESEASGMNSSVIGSGYSRATGNYSIILGGVGNYASTSDDNNSAAIVGSNECRALNSQTFIASSYKCDALGDHSTVLDGYAMVAQTYHELVMGNVGIVDYTITDHESWNVNDPIFRIGMNPSTLDADTTHRQDGFAVGKSGRLVVGIHYLGEGADITKAGLTVYQSPYGNPALLNLVSLNRNDSLQIQNNPINFSIASNKPIALNGVTVNTTHGVVFHNTDSVTIYSLPKPMRGETYYCTDCTPNDKSKGGVKVCYNGTAWKREW